MAHGAERVFRVIARLDGPFEADCFRVAVHSTPRIAGPAPAVNRRDSMMKIFLDTADVDDIRTAARWGVLDGVTTNPSLFAKVGGSYDAVLQEICAITPGPVSAEVVADDVEGMLREGRHFATLAPNIVVKVPMSEEGLEAIARFAAEGVKTNCTLIFSANQGLLA
ncbi:MAG: transaldolase family protein, partial [Candidatus Limnocylindrales bacterium]